MQSRRLTAILTLSMLCSACASAPQRQVAEDELTTQSYSRSFESAGENAVFFEGVLSQENPWWYFYNDNELNALVDEALMNNPDINQTRSRLEQAAATVDISFSDLLPDVTVSGVRTADWGDNESPSAYALAGAASYELDLWGGNRASYTSDKLAAQAAAEDIRTAAITLSASVVENWITLVSLREEESLLRDQIETNEMVLDLQQKRYENGAAQALDVLQQNEILERTRAQLPDVLSDQEITSHMISVLAGKTPSTPLDVTRSELPEILPVPPAGVPADLLSGRPDISAAWLRVTSADWATEAARINRLPNFDISADLSTASTKFAGLFETWMLDLALSLAAPLFDGRQRAAEQARQKAIADESFQNYRDVVLTSIQDVEDALSRNYHQDDKVAAIERQLEVSRNSLEQATISYGNGDAEYLSVLNSLINVQSLEQQLVRARRDLALFRIALYRSLGLYPWKAGVNG